jgi:hypothetical protein
MRIIAPLMGLLVRAAKRFAIRKDRSRAATLPTGGTGGVRPGVDLNNSAALLEVMEGTS